MRVGHRDRPRRLGRALHGPPRPRLGRRPGITRGLPASTAAGPATERGDRLPPTGSTDSTNSRSRAGRSQGRRSALAVARDRLLSGEGPLRHTAAAALHTGPVRSADRVDASELPARGRLHQGRLGAPDRHPCRLTGPAGGTFSHGRGGEPVEIGALDFVRTLCGRLVDTGVLRHALPLNRHAKVCVTSLGVEDLVHRRDRTPRALAARPPDLEPGRIRRWQPSKVLDSPPTDPFAHSGRL